MQKVVKVVSFFFVKMNYFTLAFLSLLFTYGCLCNQTAKENLIIENLGIDQEDENSMTTTTTIIEYKQSLDPLNQTADQLNEIDEFKQDTNQIDQFLNSSNSLSTSSAFNQNSVIPLFNNQSVDLKPVSLNNLLDRIYKKNELNNTQFREMNIIDKEKDMQTAAGHKHHKVVEHHHHHHHGKF